MRVLQSQLLSIDEVRTHPETLPPAFMTRLLDHLPDDQKNTAWFIRSEWRARDTATDQKCFQVDKQLQGLLGEDSTYFAQAAYNQKKSSGTPKKWYPWPSDSSKSVRNPSLQKQRSFMGELLLQPGQCAKKEDFYEKFRGGKGASSKPKTNSAEITYLEARLVASECLPVRGT